MLNWTIERISDIVQSVTGILFANLCWPIYKFIGWNFNIFIRIAELDVFSSEAISAIYRRTTIILTIVMVFYITFEFVKYTVSPDKISDKEEGGQKLVFKILVSILLIAFVPQIFDKAYELQSQIIKKQVLSKLILGRGAYDADYYKTLGTSFAADTFSAFYRVNYDACEKGFLEGGSIRSCEAAEKQVALVLNSMRAGYGGFSMESAAVLSFGTAIDFNGLFALIFGIFTLYVLLVYSFDVGTRYAQMLFLQIMAPVAIIGYISPQKDNMFKKWVKQCTATYLDLFIRIGLIYFILLIIRLLGDTEKFSIFTETSSGDHIGPIAYIFMVCGLLIFAQKAPKMIEELFPSLGGAGKLGYGFSFKDRWEPLSKSVNTVKKPIAATAGAIAGLRGGKRLNISDLKAKLMNPKATLKNSVSNLKGNLSKLRTDKDYRKQAAYDAYDRAKAAYSGSIEGAKTGKFKEARAATDKSLRESRKTREEGGSAFEKTFFGNRYQNEYEEFERRREILGEVSKSKDSVEKTTDKIQLMKDIYGYKADWDDRHIGNPNITGGVADHIQTATIAYGASEQTEADKDILYNTIKSELSAVYDSNIKSALASRDMATVEALTQEYQDRVESLMGAMDKEIEDGFRIKTLNSEIQDAYTRYQVAGTITYKEENKETNEVETHTVEIPAGLSLPEFIKNYFSQFKKAAELESSQIASSGEYREARANASDSKK